MTIFKIGDHVFCRIILSEGKRNEKTIIESGIISSINEDTAWIEMDNLTPKMWCARFENITKSVSPKKETKTG